MSRVHLVISEAGRASLAQAGVSVGWLRAWIGSVGPSQVGLHALEGIDWNLCKGWRLVIGSEDELMRVAVAHGKHIGADNNGRRIVVSAQRVALANPDRSGWFYRHGEVSGTLLLPAGELAYQRDSWLSLLNAGGALEPLCICLEGCGELPLEPGLAASFGVVGEGPPEMLNDQGYLPEEQLLYVLCRHGLKLRTAESCTAGGIAARISRVPGASDVLDRGWITYSNEAKQEMLGVSAATLEKHGAVSSQTVTAMARSGVGKHAACIAVSGIAGPSGGTDEKPVGTVWMAVATPGREVLARRFLFSGSRAEIQNRAAVYAMALLIHRLEGRPHF